MYLWYKHIAIWIRKKLLKVSILSLGICTSTALVLGNSDLGLLSTNRIKQASLDWSWYFNNEEIEYNNFSGFLSRFNVERLISGNVRGKPTTLSN